MNYNIIKYYMTQIKNKEDIILFINKKISFFEDVIQKTIINVQKNKILDILGMNDVNLCINALQEISIKISNLNLIKINSASEITISLLQEINNDISGVLKQYGTESLMDLINICVGLNNDNLEKSDKFNLLRKYFHPIHYKIIQLKKSENEPAQNYKKINEDYITEKTPNLECMEIPCNAKKFHIRVYGMKLYIYNEITNTHLLIYGIVDDIILKLLNNNFIENINKEIIQNLPNDVIFKSVDFENYKKSNTLKDFLIIDTL